MSRKVRPLGSEAANASFGSSPSPPATANRPPTTGSTDVRLTVEPRTPSQSQSGPLAAAKIRVKSAGEGGTASSEETIRDAARSVAEDPPARQPGTPDDQVQWVVLRPADEPEAPKRIWCYSRGCGGLCWDIWHVVTGILLYVCDNLAFVLEDVFVDGFFFWFGAGRLANDPNNDPTDDLDCNRWERRLIMLQTVKPKKGKAPAFTKVTHRSNWPTSISTVAKDLGLDHQSVQLYRPGPEGLQVLKNYCLTNGFAGFTREAGLACFFYPAPKKPDRPREAEGGAEAEQGKAVPKETFAKIADVLGKYKAGSLARKYRALPTSWRARLTWLRVTEIRIAESLGLPDVDQQPRITATAPKHKRWFPGGSREAFVRDGAETFVYVGMAEFQSKAILDHNSSNPESCRGIAMTMYNKTAAECTEICRAKPLRYLGFCIVKRKEGKHKVIFYNNKALEALKPTDGVSGKGMAKLEHCPDCTTWLRNEALRERGLLDGSLGGDRTMGWAGPSTRRMAGEDPWSSGQQADDDEESRMQDLPWVTLSLVLVAFCLYAAFRLRDGKDVAGLDSFWPHGETRLAIHEDCDGDFRFEIWRWFLHQFSHLSWWHVTGNCIGVLFFGIPLEGFHGHGHFFLMFQMGVLGGAFGFFGSEVHSSMVGMSGGLFGLMGIQLGDILVNWDSAMDRWGKASETPGISQSQRFEIMKVVLIVGYIVSEWQRAMFSNKTAGETSVSDYAHAGGLVAGIFSGVVIGRNIDRTYYEWGLGVVCVAAGVVMCAWILTYSVLTWPPKDMFDDYRWCWARQVVNPNLLGTEQLRCVRCGTAECIDRWANSTVLASVNPRDCVDFLGGWAASG